MRMGRDLWEQLGTVSGDRSALIRAFARWYVREPGAKLPKRPDSIPRTADTDQAIDPGHSGV